MPWEVIGQVSGIFTLVAFLGASVGEYYRRKLVVERKIIESAPESERARIILARIGVMFDVNTGNLKKSQQYDLAVAQIQSKAESVRLFAIAVVLAAVLAAIVMIVAIVNGGDKARTETLLKAKEAEVRELKTEKERLWSELRETHAKLEEEIRKKVEPPSEGEAEGESEITVASAKPAAKTIEALSGRVKELIAQVNEKIPESDRTANEKAEIQRAEITTKAAEIISFDPRLVACIAYSRLNSTSRDAVIRDLESLPFVKDSKESSSNGEMPADSGLTAFVTASRFRIPREPFRFKYERWSDKRASWTYIDTPIDAGWNFKSSTTVDLEPTEDEDSRTYNLVQTLKLVRKRLHDSGRKPADRAVDICKLIQLVTYIHQPLHTASLFTKKFQKGDCGGSMIEVDEFSNLHSVWDGFLGGSALADIKALAAKSEALVSDPSLTDAGKTALKSIDVDTWYHESYDLAREVAYQPTVLNQIMAQENAGNPYIRLDDKYLTDVGNTLRKRMVEAGFRLSALLRELYGDPNPTPIG